MNAENNQLRYLITETLVEPGPTGPNFGAGLVKADPLPSYDETPVGELRRAWAAGSFRVTGDASKVVDAMIAAADEPSPPIRLTLGSIAYDSIRSALRDRVAMLGDHTFSGPETLK